MGESLYARWAVIPRGGPLCPGIVHCPGLITPGVGQCAGILWLRSFCKSMLTCTLHALVLT